MDEGTLPGPGCTAPLTVGLPNISHPVSNVIGLFGDAGNLQSMGLDHIFSPYSRCPMPRALAVSNKNSIYRVDEPEDADRVHDEGGVAATVVTEE
jgi:hypothetical protein